jgi:acetylornithine deacetylase/succinyl-diaminopimelate desuccinylase-like protein
MTRFFALLLGATVVTGAALAAAPAPETLLLREYLRLDTQNPPGNEHLAARAIGVALAEAGIASRLLVTAEGRTSLYARLEATVPYAPTLVLLHHMDVVAPGPGWSRDPFAAEIFEGRIYGRGAIDTKSLGIAHLAAFLDLARSGKPLRRTVILLATADEETGGAHGVGFLLAQHPELFVGVEAVLNEGGANRMVGDRLLWWGIETAQKRPLWLEVVARGRPGHASGYHPMSASHRLLGGLARLVALPQTWRVTPPARDFLAALLPLHNKHWQPFLGDVDGHITPSGPKRGSPFMPGMENLFLDTLQVTVLDAGAQINVVPAEARAKIDIRLLPDSDEAAVLEKVRTALGPEVEITVLLRAPPSTPSPTSSAVYREIAAFFGREGPVVPAFAYGLTDSHFFRERGIAAYGVSPFAISADRLGGVHGPDESIPIADFEQGVLRMKALLRALAVAPE